MSIDWNSVQESVGGDFKNFYADGKYKAKSFHIVLGAITKDFFLLADLDNLLSCCSVDLEIGNLSLKNLSFNEVFAKNSQ